MCGSVITDVPSSQRPEVTIEPFSVIVGSVALSEPLEQRAAIGVIAPNVGRLVTVITAVPVPLKSDASHCASDNAVRL